MLLVAVVVAAVALAAVWVVDDAWQLRVAASGVLVVVVIAMLASARSSSTVVEQLWRESLQWQNELTDVQREVAELRSQHLELLLELRQTRAELSASVEAAERRAQVRDDQQALMHQLLQPRPAPVDPVYPSLRLPLVRAAFSTELPAPPPPAAPEPGPRLEREESSGREPLPPRQLLDLTASEIARLRPAN
jgi:hypothetical protein